MKLTNLRRRGGKTTIAIALCQKTGAVLVVANRTMVRLAIEMGLPEDQVMTHVEFINRDFERFRGRPYKAAFQVPELIIDDADGLLQRVASPYAVVRHATMSKPFSKAECLKYGIDPKGTRI